MFWACYFRRYDRPCRKALRPDSRRCHPAEYDLRTAHKHPAFEPPAGKTSFWEDTVHFAGTETAENLDGYMEGALPSADRAVWLRVRCGRLSGAFCEACRKGSASWFFISKVWKEGASPNQAADIGSWRRMPHSKQASENRTYFRTSKLLTSMVLPAWRSNRLPVSFTDFPSRARTSGFAITR